MDTINLKVPHISFRGEYRAILRNEDESIVYDSGWERNLITTLGENLYSHEVNFSNWYTNCIIGSSGATPQYTDTVMGALLAKTTNILSNDPVSNSYNAGANDYERYVTRTWRFGSGIGTGTVAEMGLGVTGSSNYLFSHHLLDTPIVKASNQSLDVSYRFTIWPSLIVTTATPI